MSTPGRLVWTAMPRIDIYHPMKTLGNARKKLNALALFPIFLGLGSLLFWPSFDSAWLMDDFPVLVNNPDIRSLANFFEDYYRAARYVN